MTVNISTVQWGWLEGRWYQQYCSPAYINMKMTVDVRICTLVFF